MHDQQDTGRGQAGRRLVVFTDLDGTLLDHDSYDFSPARPALDALKQRDIPLVLASSKTRAEMEPLQRELGITHPAIVENGAGIFIPEGYFPDTATPGGIAGAVPRAMILKALEELPEEMRGCFHGFSGWSLEEIAERTGLGPRSAGRAAQRQWSEPGLWTGDAEAMREFEAALQRHGLRLLRGGRFLQVMGRKDKAEAMQQLLARFAATWGSRPLSVALGDAPNDAAMLEAADCGFIIPNPAGAPLPRLEGENAGKILRMAETGPAGWNRAVLGVLQRLQGP